MTMKAIHYAIHHVNGTVAYKKDGSMMPHCRVCRTKRHVTADPALVTCRACLKLKEWKKAANPDKERSDDAKPRTGWEPRTFIPEPKFDPGTVVTIKVNGVDSASLWAVAELTEKGYRVVRLGGSRHFLAGLSYDRLTEVKDWQTTKPA